MTASVLHLQKSNRDPSDSGNSLHGGSAFYMYATSAHSLAGHNEMLSSNKGGDHWAGDAAMASIEERALVFCMSGRSSTAKARRQ